MTEIVTATVIEVALDDELMKRKLLVELELAGFELVDAGGVAAAFDRALETRPDLILLDANTGTGLEALRRLLADPDLYLIPVITLTSDPGVPRLVDCLAAGARDHVRAPVELAELLARIDSALRTYDELMMLRTKADRLQLFAVDDELTGLASRRQLDDEFERLAAAAARHHHELSVLLVGIDAWASVASYGTDVADAVLEEVAVLITTIRRRDDLAGRWNATEFGLLLPMTGAEGARVFAERLRAVVAAAPVPTSAGPVPVTLTVAGLAFEAKQDPQGLFARLEAVVADIRAAGGNRYEAVHD